MLKPLPAIVLLLAASQPAIAHGVWVADRWGEPAIVYGHGASDDPYQAGKITAVRAFDEDGKALPVTVKPSDRHATLAFEGEPAVVTVEFDNGFWSERPDGSWVNEGRSEVPDAKSAGHYVKHNVTLLHVHDRVPELPPQPMQIVPLANPLGREPGDALRVRVLLDGQPLAGAEVIADYVNMPEAEPAVTDGKGEAVVTIRNDGLNVIAASHDRPLAGNPDADKRGHFATLAFLLHEHED